MLCTIASGVKLGGKHAKNKIFLAIKCRNLRKSAKYLKNRIKIAVSSSVFEFAHIVQSRLITDQPPTSGRMVNCLLRVGCHHIENKFSGDAQTASTTLKSHRPEREGDSYANLSKPWETDFRETFRFLGEDAAFDRSISRGIICDSILRFAIADIERANLIHLVYRCHRKALQHERKDGNQLWLPLPSSDCNILSKGINPDREISPEKSFSAESVTAFTRFFLDFLNSIRQMDETSFQVFAKKCIEKAKEVDALRVPNDRFLLLEGVEKAITDKLDKVRGENDLDYVLRGVASVAVNSRKTISAAP